MTKIEHGILTDLQKLVSTLGHHIDECRKGIKFHREGEFRRGVCDDSCYMAVRMERLRNLSHFQADIMQIIDEHNNDIVKRYNLITIPEDRQDIVVSTPAGNILASRCPDSNYPGIVVTIDSDKRPANRDVALVEYDRESGGYRMYAWDEQDIHGDSDYTNIFKYSVYGSDNNEDER